MRGLARIKGTAEGRAALALVFTAVVLTVLEFHFLPSRVEMRLRGATAGPWPPPSMRAGLTWAIGTIVGNLVLPALIVRGVHREPLSSVGWSTRGLVGHLRVYLGLYALMVPVIWVVAQRPDFRWTYPFVSEATQDMRSFLLWESFYLAQFFALEAFFRGYLLFTLERAMGRLAIFVMTVPYAMIHFHKPFPEALGAIVAGIALGWLALRYRSWLGGAVLHALVALTMDSLAAHRAGLF